MSNEQEVGAVTIRRATTGDGWALSTRTATLIITDAEAAEFARRVQAETAKPEAPPPLFHWLGEEGDEKPGVVSYQRAVPVDAIAYGRPGETPEQIAARYQRLGEGAERDRSRQALADWYQEANRKNTASFGHQLSSQEYDQWR